MNNVLIRWYPVKKNEIEILEKVSERQRELEKSTDNSYLLRVWLIESALGYKGVSNLERQDAATEPPGMGLRRV